jgi:glutathione S-transferase
MSEDLVFYTNPASRGRIVRWMLEEVGQPYRTEYLDFGGMKADAYRAINPMGKVPSLVHKGKVITECAAICAYLADAFPQAGLKPGAEGLADYYRWLFFAAGPVESAVTNTALKVEVSPQQRAFVGYGSLSEVLDALEGAVSGKNYIAGDQFSAADVYVGAQIAFGLQFGTIERRQAFETYSTRMSNRPAAVRAREIDDAKLAA